MNNFINNSGFLFSTYKHDPDKRLCIAVSCSSTEPHISGYTTINEIIYHINNYYKNKCNDMCPYHYIVTKDGEIHNIKDPILSVPNKGCKLQEYENDIRILVMSDRPASITRDQKNALIKIMSKESNDYALLLSETIFFYADKNKLINDDLVAAEIIKKSILERNKLNSLFCIVEHVINGKIIINEKVGVIPPLTDELTLDDVSIRYRVDRAILSELNPHISNENSSDIIFIPNTSTFKYSNSAKALFKSFSVKAYELKDILNRLDSNREVI